MSRPEFAPTYEDLVALLARLEASARAVYVQLEIPRNLQQIAVQGALSEALLAARDAIKAAQCEGRGPWTCSPPLTAYPHPEVEVVAWPVYFEGDFVAAFRSEQHAHQYVTLMNARWAANHPNPT